MEEKAKNKETRVAAKNDGGDGKGNIRAFVFFTAFSIRPFSSSHFSSHSSSRSSSHALFFERPFASLCLLYSTPPFFASFTPPPSPLLAHIRRCTYCIASACASAFFHFHRAQWMSSRRWEEIDHLLQSQELHIRCSSRPLDLSSSSSSSSSPPST
ncbi:unnamed protein product [Taenia asiatica]|uniref:Uncharacterized protein n=1 Tax=Taenia asiatica TaxID=60517 RepID=A0A0R3VXX9_TAEAS|nr:unnamed protein product [Taenia asiatica]